MAASTNERIVAIRRRGIHRRPSRRRPLAAGSPKPAWRRRQTDRRWYQRFDDVENLELDLRDRTDCVTALWGATSVYNLAADMGGMGFIENNKAFCMLSVLINTHLLMASREAGIRVFFCFFCMRLCGG